jgi:hypothetical protein
MKRNNILVHSVLAGLAILTLGQVPKAGAETILVQQGPHGAVQWVERDGQRPTGGHHTIGTTVLPTTGSQGFPDLVSRGSHGAVSIDNHGQKMEKTMSKMKSTPKESLSPQSTNGLKMAPFRSSGRRSAEELLQITNQHI